MKNSDMKSKKNSSAGVRWLICLLMLVGLSWPVLGQTGGPSIAGMAWTQDVEFGWLEASGGTLIFTTPDVDFFVTETLPFTFNYYGADFTTVDIAPNGFVTFNDYPVFVGSINNALTLTTQPDSMLAVFWDDQIGTVPSGDVYIQTFGNAPYRQYVIQWDAVKQSTGGADITFQIVLYETLNIIKYQYLDVGLLPPDRGSEATVGLKFTDGSGSPAQDSLLYSFNTASLTDGRTLIFYPSDLLTATTNAPTPSQVAVGTSFQFFDVSVTDVQLSSATDLQNMGKADVLAIANPLAAGNTGGSVDTMYVFSVTIDGEVAALQNRNSAPTPAEYASDLKRATWYYDSSLDSLFIRVPPHAILDSISVNFLVEIPDTSLGNYAFNTRLYSRFNADSAATGSASFTLGTAEVDNFAINPTTDITLVAGSNPLNSAIFGITAFDEFGNKVINDDTLDYVALGSTTADFDPDFSTFRNLFDSVTVRVADQTAGTFVLSAISRDDPTKKANSGVITILPDVAASITVLNSLSAITVGNTRRLSVRLEDQFANVHSDSVITFTILGTGDAVFVNSQLTTDNATTNSLGIAEIDYRASTLVSAVNDTIRASIGGVTQDIVIPLQAGGIDRFALTITGSNPVGAGSNTQIQVEALDVYGNAVVNSSQIQAVAVGTSGATFTPATGLYTFASSSTTTITVNDSTVGNFTVRAELVSDPTRLGTSASITVTAGALAELRIRDSGGNGGSLLSNVDQNLSASGILTLFAAGYDAFGNYLADIDSAVWDSTATNGALTPTAPFVFPFTDSRFDFSPAEAGNGSIFVSIPTSPGIQADTTGTITVTAGDLSFIRIQTDSLDAGTEVGNVTQTAGDTQQLFAVGYDDDNNRIGTIAANWVINNTALGTFTVTGTATQNNSNQVTFQAETVGNGIITATAVSDGTISDQTGLITVNAGAATSITIRNAASGAGTAYNATPLTMTTDSSIVLFAASYDTFDNFVADRSVTWGSDDFTLTNTGPASSITFSPSATGSGTIFTADGSIDDDTTATITVNVGALDRLVIQSLGTALGVEVESMTLTAGEDTLLFAAGYDADDNLIGQISANWSLEGDAIGTFGSANPSTSNTLTVDSIGKAVVRATQDLGTLTDVTSTITVVAAAAATISKVDGDNQTAPAGSQLPRDISVLVLDAFSNPVSGQTVTFTPLGGGSVSSGSVATNSQGIAVTQWTIQSTAGADSLSASTGVLTPLTFRATVTGGAASTLATVGATTQTGQVDTDLAAPFTVQVDDGSGNPVENAVVNFVIRSRPAGATLDSLLTDNTVLTNASGQASTTLHLGSKLGNYVVRASTGITTPNFVDFTGTADIANAADSILIVSGNNQSAAAGSTLGNSIVFRLVDDFENGLSGQTVNFNASNGSVTPTSASSDASGLVSTSWTLSDTAGQQQLSASLQGSPGITSGTVLATATAGAAAIVELVSLRGQASDSVAAIIGEDVTFRARVTDALGNALSNQTVTFASAAGFNATFDVNSAITGADGQVLNVVTPDPNRDSTFFEARVAGVDTLTLHLYHLTYEANTLQDSAASPGDDVAFSLVLRNRSFTAVNIGNATTFNFDDGSNTYSSNLSGGLSIAARDTATLSFDSQTINANFANTLYTPVVTVAGTGSDSLLNGEIKLPSNSLSLFTVEITTITSNPTQVARGDTFTVTMTVSNLSQDTVSVDSVDLSFSGGNPLTIVAQTAGPLQLLPNTPNNVFTFDVAVPLTADGTSRTIDGYFEGTINGGRTVVDGAANSPSVITLVNATEIALVAGSLTPTTVTNGGAFEFQVDVLASGGFDVVLDPTNTFVTFDNDTSFLKQSYSAPSGSVATIEFAPITITAAASVIRYAANVRLNGTANSLPFDSTVTIADTILVQNPPNVFINLTQTPDDPAAQGQDSLTVALVISNIGTNNASAIISRPDSLTIFTTGGLSNITSPDFTSLTLASGQSSPTYTFTYSLSESYPTGLDELRARVGYQDANSGASGADSSNVFDYTVLSRANVGLVPGSASLVPDTAAAGQSGVALSFTLQNTGGSVAEIDAGDIDLQFTNSHTLVLTSPALPVTIDGGQQQVFTYDMTVDPTAASGIDPYDLSVSYLDTLSDKSYSLSVNNADTLTIADQAAINITSVLAENATFAFDSVSLGAQNVPVAVRLENTGESALLLDRVRLNFVPAGIYTGVDTTFAAPITIAANQSQVVNFLVDVDAANTTGLKSLGATAFGRDANSLAAITESGADTTDSWRLVTPAVLNFISITPSIVNVGQSVQLTATVQNTGQAEAALIADSTFLTFDTRTIFLVQRTLVPGNSSVDLIFNSVTVAPPAIGAVVGTLTANNYEENGFTNSDTLSPINFSIVDPAALTYQSLVIPDTVGQNQQFSINLTLENSSVTGSAAIIDSIVIADLGITQSFSNTIQPGNSLVINPISGSFDQTVAGDTSVTVNVFWRDAVTLAAMQLDSTQTITVLTQAAINISGITAPNFVSPGETVDSVLIQVTNSGQVTADITAITFDPLVGFYSQIVPAAGNPASVSGGQTVDLYYDFTVASNSGTGSDTISVTANGQDSLNFATVTDDSSFSWVIQSSGDFVINSALPTLSTVSRNQQNVTVNVSVTNQGSLNLQLDTLRLAFTNGNVNYGGELTRGFAPAAEVLVPSETRVYPFLVDIAGGAQLGSDVIDASGQATELLSSVALIESGVTTTGSWTVQERPNTVLTATLGSDTLASTGQSGLLFTVNVSNNGGVDTTATASIDSIGVLINGSPNDLSNIVLTALNTPPATLNGGASFTTLYNVSVQDTALAGDYIIAYQIFYSDANDSNFVSTLLSAQDTLRVVDAVMLEVVSMTLSSDSAAVGQTGLRDTVRVANNSGAPARLLTSTLTFAPALSFTQRLLSPLSLPQRIEAGDSLNLVYEFDVPASAPANTTVDVGIELSALDLNSNTDVTVDIDSAAALTIVEGAFFSFDSLSPLAFNLNDSADFEVVVTNTGGSTVLLDASTTYLFSGASADTAFLDGALTGLSFAPGETDTLFFQRIGITGAGTHLPVVTFNGVSNGKSYAQNLNTANILVGGDFAISAFDVVPSEVAPGQTGVRAIVRIVSQNQLVVDPSSTISFTYQAGGIFLPQDFTRIDTVSTLSVGIPADLIWEFTIPDPSDSGFVDATAVLNFNNSGIDTTVTTSFLIQSGIDLAYSPLSLTPAQVVPRQNVAFTAIVTNSGNTDLNVSPDNSSLTFTDGTNTFTALVNGAITIRGADTTEARPTTIPFVADSIPENFIPGNYTFSIILNGTLPNGQAFDGATLSSGAEVVSVLSGADLVVDAIDILPQTVTLGQSFVEVQYTLRNAGQSNARVNSLNSVFTDTSDTDVSASWLTVFNSNNFPFTITAGNSQVFTRRFNVLTSSPTGLITGTLQGNYNDVRRPADGDTLTFDSSPVSDSVTVIGSSAIFITALEADLLTVLNPPFVNWGQAYNLNLSLNNNGDDQLTVYLRILKNGNPFISDTLSGAEIPANTITTTSYPDVADSLSSTVVYTAIIDSAISLTSSDLINPGQAIDNNESIQVQEPRRLALTLSSDRSSLSEGQLFTVTFAMNSFGASAFDNSGQVQLVLPGNYSFVSPLTDTLPFSSSSLSGSWTLRADDSTAINQLDTLRANLIIVPNDLNVNQPVAINAGDSSDFVTVQTGALANIFTQLNIESPAGAVDGTVSTLQSFLLRNTLVFTGEIAPTDRRTQLILPAGRGYSVQGASIIALDSVASDTAWTVFAPSTPSPAGADTIIVQTFGRDQNTNEEVSMQDSVFVTVENRANLVFNSAVTQPAGAIDDLVSTNQRFVWELSLQNIGEAGFTGSANVSLTTPNSGFFFDSLRDSTSLDTTFLAGAPLAVDIYTDVVASGLRTVQATLQSLPLDANSGQPVQIVSPNQAVSKITVTRADLQLTLLGPAIVDVADTFIVIAEVRNLGDAQINPDSVEIALSGTSFNGFNLLAGEDSVKFVPMNSGTVGQTIFQFESASVAGGSDTLAASIIDVVASDTNDYSSIPVFKSQPADTLNIEVQEGSILVTITEPAVSGDSVSTEQLFTVTADFVFSDNVAVTNRTATIALPTGFALDQSTPATRPVSGNTATLSWLVIAPANPLAGSQAITVRGNGQDSFSSAELEGSDVVTVILQRKASLSPRVAIVAPDSARINQRMSTTQLFDLEVRTVNQAGAASTTGNDTVLVTLPSGFQFVENGRQDTTVFFNTSDSVVIRARAASAVGVSPLKIVRGELLGTSIDNNTGLPAFILGDSTFSRTFSLQKRAELQLSVNSLINFVSDQNANVSVSVENAGDAGTIPDTVRVQLFSRNTDSLVVNSPAVAIPLINGSGTGEFNITAGPNPTIVPDTVDVRVVAPFAVDANTDSTVEVLALSDSTFFTYLINDGGNALALLTLDSATVGILDSTVSSQQQFRVRAAVTFLGPVDVQNRQITLNFPTESGFSIIGSDATQNLSAGSEQDTVFWLLRAPEAPSGVPAEKVRGDQTGSRRQIQTTTAGAVPADRAGEVSRDPLSELLRTFQTTIFNTTVTFFDSLSGAEANVNSNDLPISVEERASLRVNSRIISPDGALDARVSTLQQFDMEVSVDNLGEALLTGDSRVAFALPAQYLSSKDTLVLADGQQDTVTITVPDVAEAALIRSVITSAAIDNNTGAPAAIVSADTAIALNVVQRADLRAAVSVPTVVALNAPFTVTGKVSNAGDAGVEVNDLVYVAIEFNSSEFELVSGDSLQARRLVGDTTDYNWQLRPLILGAANVAVNIDTTLSYDENYDPSIPVHASLPTAQTSVTSEDGLVRIDSVNFAGSNDSLTISTGQKGLKLIVKNKISDLYSLNRQATIVLPAASFSPDTLIRAITSDSLVIALPVPSLSTNNLWEPIAVSIAATSPTDNVTLTATDTLHVLVQDAAQLSITGRLAGVINSTVSFGQTFDFEAIVRKSGQAGISSGGTLNLNFDATNLALVGGQATQPFAAGDTVVWNLQAAQSTAVTTLKQKITDVQAQRARAREAVARVGEESAGSGRAQVVAIKAYDQQLAVLYRNLTSVIVESFMEVEVSSVPLDVNTQQPVALTLISDSIALQIAEAPVIEITQVTNPATVSTSQVLTVEVDVNAPENVISRSGTLTLPAGFAFLNNPPDPTKPFTGDSVAWTIRAPAEIGSGEITANLDVQLSGRDVNDTSRVVSDQRQINLTVQRAAQLDLQVPSSSRQLSAGQPLQLSARVLRTGFAALDGDVQVQLVDPDSILIFNDSAVKTVSFASGNTQNVTWNLLTPDTNVTSTVLTVEMITIPNDVNTGEPAVVLNQSANIFLALVANQLLVERLTEVQPNSTYRRGDTDVPMIGLSFTNENVADSILVRNMVISVNDGNSANNLVSDISPFLSLMKVVTYEPGSGIVSKSFNVQDLLGQSIIGETTPNPFRIDFTNNLPIDAGETAAIAVTIDIAASSPNANFGLRVNDVGAVLASDSSEVEVQDSLGVLIKNQIFGFSSSQITILSDNPEQIFGNFPNPFGMDKRPRGGVDGTTWFTFFLENDARLELRLYTLTGRLVRILKPEQEVLPRGLYDSGELRWDGFNGEGRQVVNGVYVAVLNVSYTNGGNDKYKTKVVYIK